MDIKITTRRNGAWLCSHMCPLAHCSHTPRVPLLCTLMYTYCHLIITVTSFLFQTQDMIDKLLAERQGMEGASFQNTAESSTNMTKRNELHLTFIDLEEESEFISTPVSVVSPQSSETILTCVVSECASWHGSLLEYTNPTNSDNDDDVEKAKHQVETNAECLQNNLALSKQLHKYLGHSKYMTGTCIDLDSSCYENARAAPVTFELDMDNLKVTDEVYMETVYRQTSRELLD